VIETKGEYSAKIMKSRIAEEISAKNTADASAYSEHITN
jgi:hypothetical protein